MRFSFLLIALIAFATSARAADESDQMRTDLAHQFATLFDARNFVELDRLEKSYQSDQEKAPNGEWKLAYFYDGIKELAKDMGGEDHWKGAEAAAEDWIAKTSSPASHIAYAELVIQHALTMVVGSSIEEVSEEKRWKVDMMLGKIYRSLQSCGEACKSDPQWYVAMINLARIDQWSPEDASRLYTEAVKAHPYYDPIYLSIADNLSRTEVADKYVRLNEFANHAVEITGSKDGYGMYARIYAHLTDGDQSTHIDVFNSSLANCETMKRGIDDILAAYPDQWNINHFAYLSCIAKDMAETRALTDRVNVSYVSAWGGDLNKYAACKRQSH